jgi:predicted MFS family arabinose efflux permease
MDEDLVSRFLLFGLFTIAQFISFFYNASNAVIAPDLSRDLSLSSAELGFTTSLFFAVFALAQLPVGVTLDLWGPRVVVPSLMVIGGAGSLVFAGADSFGTLALGRALIGVGMAGTLMGAFKAFSLWFPPERFARVSGLLMGIGVSGTLGAATPLAWASQVFGWRPVFGWGASLTFLSAASIFLWTRNAPPGVATNKVPAGGNLRGFFLVFTHLQFWGIALVSLFVTGNLFALQSLWLGPYLFDVVGLSRITAGNVMLFTGLGVASGFVASGWLADRFGTTRIVVVESVLFTLCQLALAFGLSPEISRVVFFLFGFSGGGCAVALLSQTRLSFPLEMTGRAVSAVNSFAFAGAFLVQWLIGMILSFFPATEAGHHPPEAYTTALLWSTSGTVLALVCYLATNRKTSVFLR